MNQRIRDRVVPGQIWRSSDPRRLSSFRIVMVNKEDAFVVVDGISPLPGFRTLRLEAFQTLGSKGYTLMKDNHAI